VPANWVSFRHPVARYTIAHPPGWTIRRNGVNTDIRDPATGAYIRVAYRTPPGADATQAWREFEPGFARRQAGYDRIASTRRRSRA
jgi:hypothetical protein